MRVCPNPAGHVPGTGLVQNAGLPAGQILCPRCPRYITITTEATGGVGASRRVFCKGRPPVDETVISWDEGEGFTVRLHKGQESPSPFAEATFTYRLRDAEDGACLAQVELCYRLPDSWWSGIMDGLLMRHVVAHTVRSIAKGLRQVYETGKSANPLVPE